MKHYIARIFCCAVLLASAVANADAENGIIDTRHYSLCPGDKVTIGTRQISVSNDTIMYDTIRVLSTDEDSIYRYVVNIYPPFEKKEDRLLEAGKEIQWCDTVIRNGGTYQRIYQSIHGCDSIYRLHVTVEIDKTFTICDDESVQFNGQTYTNAGTYYNTYTTDTVYKIVITKYPTPLHIQNGILNSGHPYYWQYSIDGEQKTDTISQPGVYEYTTHNETTGCNDIWRLILIRDESKYHFLENVTICESEEFSWRGRNHLNRQGIGQTTHYFDRYQTAGGQDSIYELALTVRPVERTTRTIPFCGSVEWKGQTITESKTFIDTLTSTRYSCDSIITTVFSLGMPFHHHDTATIVPGERLEWHGKTITTSGLYEDRNTSSYGCDSIYSLGVGIKEAAPQTPIHSERASICEGSEYPWRGKNYREEGTYVDTLFRSGSTTDIDSLYVLQLTVNPTYAWTERMTFTSFPTSYRGETITGSGTYYARYTSSLGCDSIITIIVNREVIRDEQFVTICPGETFIWRGHEYNEAYRYVETETDAAGEDSVEHVLNLTVRYIPETRITRTICSGGSYTFGDRTLTESGIYRHTFHETGCDSVVVLSLNVVSADTITYVHHINEGDSYVWHGKTYRDSGVDFYTTTNRYGCDSTEMLVLTVNHVDTIDSTAVICPGETLAWHGIRASQSGTFTNAEAQVDGSYNYYRLHLTVRELAVVDSLFTICGDESVTFNGKTYTSAGHYYDYAGCDTLYHLTIRQIPTRLYVTNASLSATGGYTWTYRENGTERTRTFAQPGTYEYESENTETGCMDRWRLILTKDETNYHFVERQTICEGDEFNWRGKNNLSGQPGVSHYYDNYITRAGKDSIYELVLTVTPVKRSIQTITFCGQTTWKGHTYYNSFVVYDTLVSSTGCDSIVRMNFDKATAHYYHDTATIVQGETLEWHGLHINTDGLYRDAYTNQFGCDSIYELGVGVTAATPQTNLYTTQYTICDGDSYEWRGKQYMAGGTYVDTIYKAGTNNIDSIFSLKLTVRESYKDTVVRHLYTCGAGASIRYQGKEYWTDTTLISTLPTMYGCDSIVKVYLHFNTALFLTDTVEIADTEMPYKWTYRLPDGRSDTILTAAGTYNHTTAAEGTCVNREQLVLIVYPTYLYQQDTTICELDLPFYWLNGPSDHINDALQHSVGQTKQYEYRYQTVNNTDSIFRLNLTINRAPKSTERYYVCEGTPQKIHGKMYGEAGMKLDSLYRDTIELPVDGTVCDSTLYVEVYVSSIKQHTETVVMQEGDTIEWNQMTITSGGEYRFVTPDVGAAGCDSISILRVIQEFKEERILCSNDTGAEVHPDKKYPLIWEHPHLTHDPDTLYTSGSFRDTIYDALGYITEIYRMDLTIVQPYDTTVYVHGCLNKGALWRDELFKSDTTFIDRIEVTPYDPLQPCDSVFHVNIIIDTIYSIFVDTVVCEHMLPLIIGRQDPDTIWEERPFFHYDTTSCGCDSIISGYLHITPELSKNDSTFICEDEIKQHPVTLGNLTNPWFDTRNGGEFHGKWEGKWTGVHYTTDTIVWDCNHEYSHHIIVRPSQKMVKDTTFFLCPDDTLAIFWGRGDDSTFFYKDTLYIEHTPMPSVWTDEKHHYTYSNDAYSCDSITRWHIKVLPREKGNEEKHILLGDSVWWGGAWRYYTGVYDSIAQAKDTSSLGDTCTYTRYLHLYVDTAYYYRDTIDLCVKKNRTLTHTWFDGYKQSFTVGTTDTIARHYIDSLITYDRRDSIYDLCVNYRIIQDTMIFDTICPGDSIQFDRHYILENNNTTVEQYIKTAGIYRDTLTALNGCDSIITLYLYVRDRIPTIPTIVHIPDTAAPYIWQHSWIDSDGQPKDSTQHLTASGDYRFVMPSIYGCDSIDSLVLRIHKTYRIQEDSLVICHDQTPYTWQDRNDITKTSDYTFYTLTSEGYDSIRFIHIEVLPIMHTLLLDTLCDGDSLRFGLTKMNQPRFLTSSGVYFDTLTSHLHGCDSIIELRLNVYPKYRNHQVVDIADVQLPYTWDHIQGGRVIDSELLNATGEYSYHFTTPFGCDSIDSLSLHVHQTYLFRDTVTICADETPYSWEGIKDIYTTNEYIKHLQTHDGYDSTHIRYVEVLPIMHTLMLDTLCEGDSLRFGLTKMNQPRFLTSAGVYFDTLTSLQHGCDSIIELRLNVYPKYRNHHDHHISSGELPYQWDHIQGGHVISSDMLIAAGEYSYHFTTPFGCDSIDSLSLRVHQTYNIKDDTIRICSDQTPFTWHEYNNIAATGDYTFYAQTFDGYDSIHTVHIEVSPVKYTTIPAAICEGSSYHFKGQTLTEQGTYYDTLTTVNGCDSIVTLVLTVNKPYFHTRTEHVIEGNSVEFFGQQYSATGTYTHYGTMPTGCDSTSVLQLIVHPLVDTTVVICSTELPYLWENKWNGSVTPLYAAGIYRNDTTYVNNERMFYGLQLIVNQPTDTTIYREICEGSIYNFNGRELTTSGQYRDTIRNANGCDSVMILHLNVLKKYYNVINRTIYEGDTVIFRGETYSAAGVYPVRLTSSFGCDSIIELRLSVNRLFDDSISVCANALPYIWHGKLIYESGIYRDTVLGTDNKESVIGIKINVLPTSRKEEAIQFSMCEGDYYKFGDRMLTQQGIYYDTLTAANGCDSIVMLSLTVLPMNYYSEVRRIFEGDSALFNGVWYKESGVYEYRQTNANGCTDTYQMILSVLKSFYTDTTAVICDKDLPFIWRGYEYNESGDYSLPISWTDSSRVVKTLHLTVYPSYYSEQNISLCSGDTVLFRGHKFFQSGEFLDVIPSKNGCDSIIKYIVSVHPTFDKLIDIHISDKEPFDFHGRMLTQTGKYEWTGKTVNGCDSVEHLNLTVHPSFFQSDTIDICQSDEENYPYVWKDENGRIIGTYSRTGVYNDSVLTEYGFDSVHQIVLFIHPSYLINEQYEIGEGEHLKIHGIDISTTGVYYNNLLTIHGCDSIYHLVVNKKRTREFYRNAEICQGDYYEFFGRKLTHTGNYTYTSQYKDSIVYLSLTVKPVSISEKRIVITDKQLPYIYDGRIYNAMGIYSDTLVNIHGCDSIKRLVLIVTQRYSDWVAMPLCPGSEIKIDGKVINEAGLYTFERRSRVTGEMDSLLRVEVYDAPAFDLPLERRTICEGDTLYFAGKAHTRAGHYDYNLKTVSGCDSILHLDLTVNPTYHYITDTTITDYQSVIWRGKTYFETGEYHRSWPTAQDCDSTYTLSMKVVETLRDTATVTICSGQSYTWRGKKIEADGFYADTVWQPESRFSAIYALRLIVAYPTNIVSARTGDICADADGFDIYFEYAGERPTHYSVYFDALAKREGFVDIIDEPLYGEMVAHIQLPQFNSIAYETHPYYVRPDYYTLHIALDNGVCGISRSDSVTLLIKYPSWILEQNWMDVVAPLKSAYNGGFEFAKTEWFVNDVPQPKATAGYLYSTELIKGDQVVMKATRKGENYAIPTCPLTITDPATTNHDVPVIVNPTQAPKTRPIFKVTAPQDGLYEVYSATGLLILKGTLLAGETEITLPPTNGMFFIRALQGSETSSHKVLVY